MNGHRGGIRYFKVRVEDLQGERGIERSCRKKENKEVLSPRTQISHLTSNQGCHGSLLPCTQLVGLRNQTLGDKVQPKEAKLEISSEDFCQEIYRFCISDKGLNFEEIVQINRF